jgi:hypothetical protein
MEAKTGDRSSTEFTFQIDSIDVCGQLVLVGGSQINIEPCWNGEVDVVEFESDRKLHIKKRFMMGCGSNCSAWLGNKGDAFVAGLDDGSIQVWSVISSKKDKPLRVMSEHDDIVTSISICLDKETFLSASWDGK